MTFYQKVIQNHFQIYPWLSTLVRGLKPKRCRWETLKFKTYHKSQRGEEETHDQLSIRTMTHYHTDALEERHAFGSDLAGLCEERERGISINTKWEFEKSDKLSDKRTLLVLCPIGLLAQPSFFSQHHITKISTFWFRMSRYREQNNWPPFSTCKTLDYPLCALKAKQPAKLIYWHFIGLELCLWAN